MHATRTVTPSRLPEVLLNVAVVRPVFLWGAPGIGKSSLVRQFAASLGLDCVSLLGTQLAPEDLMGVPRIVDGRSQFCPPEQIARDTPYVLFLAELNAAAPDVQKAFYSLILDRRIGSYELPAGYLAPGDIAGRVTVRGRGGTVLQPGVRLLENARDFPPDGPILVITDGACDVVRVHREHAFLVPAGARLPFSPKGPVFRVS